MRHQTTLPMEINISLAYVNLLRPSSKILNSPRLTSNLYSASSRSILSLRNLSLLDLFNPLANTISVMEEQPQANALASAFPTPPPFWQNFTPENIARIDELRATKLALESSDPDAKVAESANPIRLLDLPSELRCLQPPEPPLDGRYRCFGDIYNVRTPTQ